MEITFGQLQPDEWDQAFRIRSVAFDGPLTPDVGRPQLPNENVIVARADGEVIGSSAFAELGQVFGGCVLPMGGVTGIAVASHAGGRGVATGLTGRLFSLMLDRGMVISTLFPSTSTLYRSLGYESAGTWTERTLPLIDLATSSTEGIEVRETSPDVHVTMRHLHDAHAQRTNGWMLRDDWWWAIKQHECTHTDGHRRVFVAYKAEQPIALGVVANTKATKDRRAHFDLDLIDAFGEPNGLAAICAKLAGSATIAGELHTTLGFDDLAVLTDRPERLRVEKQDVWMTRILDVQAAFSARDGGVFGGGLHLEVVDPQIPRNNGRFVVTHTGNGLEVEDGGSGRITLTINDLSAMFTGFRSPESLALRSRLGDASGQDIQALTRLFAAPQPTLIDSF